MHMFDTYCYLQRLKLVLSREFWRGADIVDRRTDQNSMDFFKLLFHFIQYEITLARRINNSNNNNNNKK